MVLILVTVHMAASSFAISRGRSRRDQVHRREGGSGASPGRFRRRHSRGSGFAGRSCTHRPRRGRTRRRWRRPTPLPETPPAERHRTRRIPATRDVQHRPARRGRDRPIARPDCRPSREPCRSLLRSPVTVTGRALPVPSSNTRSGFSGWSRRRAARRPPSPLFPVRSAWNCGRSHARSCGRHRRTPSPVCPCRHYSPGGRIDCSTMLYVPIRSVC